MKNPTIFADLDPAEVWLGVTFVGRSFRSTGPMEGRRLLNSALERVIDRGIKESGQVGPPFDPMAIGRRITGLTLELEERIVSSTHVGQIVPLPHGFRVVVNPGLGSTRRRFTIAHEIGHVFFYDWSKETPSLPFGQSRYWVQEGYSMRIARLIVLPKGAFDESGVGKTLPSIAALRELSTRFDVSTEVLQRRIMDDLQLWDCAMFRSRARAGEVVVPAEEVSKGKSFERVRFPRSARSDSETSKSHLFGALNQAVSTGHFEGEIDLGRKRIWLESAVVSRSGETVLFSLARPLPLNS